MSAGKRVGVCDTYCEGGAYCQSKTDIFILDHSTLCDLHTRFEDKGSNLQGMSNQSRDLSNVALRVAVTVVDHTNFKDFVAVKSSSLRLFIHPLSSLDENQQYQVVKPQPRLIPKYL